MQHGQYTGSKLGIKSLSLLECQQQCLMTADCMWVSFSISPAPTICVLCAACELRPAFDGRNYSSYARSRGNKTRWSRGPQVVWPALRPEWLQGSYSERLYGAKGRVNLASLGLVWLQLLPSVALRFLISVGLCKSVSMPPERPFYIARDPQRINPVDAMWVHVAPPYPRGAGDTPSWHPRPAASHSWVEVTHCASNSPLLPFIA